MDEPRGPTRATPAWPPAKRFAFRFVFAYLVLYIFPFPLTSIPGLDAVAEPYHKLWKAIVHWAGKIVFYGIWNVEEETIGGQVRPPLTTDAARWRRVIFSYPESLSIQLMNDSRHRYSLELDPAKKTLGLSPRQDPRQRSMFTYRQSAPGLLELDGTLDHQTIHAELRRVKEPSFQLINRGFHWINEYPFNR